jgi:hypothetical protein
MKKLLETLFILALIPVIIAWEYYIGYAFAYGVAIFAASEIFGGIGKRGEASGGIVFLGVAFFPILILIAISIFLNEYNWFKYIEGGFFTFVVIAGLFETMASNSKDKERKIANEKIRKEREEREAAEENNFKIEDNLISVEDNVDLNKIYKEYSETQRIVGTVLVNGNSNIEYIYIEGKELVLFILPEDKKVYKYKFDIKEIMESSEFANESEKRSTLVRFTKEFARINHLVSDISQFTDIQPRFGYINSKQYALKGSSPVQSKNQFLKTLVNDNVIITKEKGEGKEYQIVFINRILSPTGLALPGNHFKNQLEAEEKTEKLEHALHKVISTDTKIEFIKTLDNSKMELNELRGSMESLISFWYAKDGINWFASSSIEDLPEHISVNIKDLPKLLETGYIESEERKLYLLPHHKLLLEKIIPMLKSDKDLIRYLEVV